MSRRAWLLFVTVAVLWGLPYLFIKAAVDHFSPVAIVWLRCLIAAVVLVPLAMRARVLGQLRGLLGPVLVLAAVEVTAPFILISAGEQHITSSLTGLLTSATPVFVAILAIRDPTERVDGRRLLGLLVGLGGVAVLLGFDVRGGLSALAGAGMVLGAAFCYAVAALVVKRSFAEVSPLAASAVAVAINSVVLAPLGVVGLPGRAPPVGVTLQVVALGLLCTAAGLLAFYALITLAGASRASVVTYLTPLVAAVLGVVVLDERVTVAMVGGIALILTGSWLSTRASPAPAAEPAEPARSSSGVVSRE